MTVRDVLATLWCLLAVVGSAYFVHQVLDTFKSGLPMTGDQALICCLSITFYALEQLRRGLERLTVWARTKTDELEGRL